MKVVRTVTSRANSLMQAGTDDDAYPVEREDGRLDTLWIPEIERFVFCALCSDWYINYIYSTQE